ncbi:golgin subfamily A member 6-like protein 22 [Mytilus californianus]|uniref:golgin subfamily A member 6-like protein 22 n=1 Tax=Mytilus californianus TaxID=6549 RepID=UPI002248184E|nr:golgin subfamily A member 6-like protein 22 [Mytilus californianus]
MAQVPVSGTKCSICSTNAGLLFCYDCQQALCATCRTVHDKISSTKNHKVTDIKKVDRLFFKTEIRCTDHQEIYTIFCTKCRCLVCNSCLTSIHKDHAFSAVDEVVEESRKEARELLNEGQEKIAIASTAIEDLKSTLNEHKQNEKEIIKTAAVLNNIVESVKQNYLQELMESSIFAKDRSKSVLQELENQKACYESVCSKIEHLLSEPHSITFYLSYDSQKKEYQDLEDISGCENLEHNTEFDVDSFIGEVEAKIETSFGRRLQNEKAKETTAKEFEENLEKLVEEENRRKLAEEEINELNSKLSAQAEKIKRLKGRRGHDPYNPEEERIEYLEIALKQSNEELIKVERELDETSRKMNNIECTLEKEEENNEYRKKLVGTMSLELEDQGEKVRSLQRKLEEESDSKEYLEESYAAVRKELEDAVCKVENSERIVCELRRRCESADEKFQDEHRIRQRLEEELKSLEDC